MSATLKSRFNVAVDLLHQKAKLGAKIAEWRKETRAEGLAPGVLLKLAREYLQDTEQRRRAAAEAEVKELYRQGLDLPLFRERAAD